jgi:hypothetical protein
MIQILLDMVYSILHYKLRENSEMHFTKKLLFQIVKLKYFDTSRVWTSRQGEIYSLITCILMILSKCYVF